VREVFYTQMKEDVKLKKKESLFLIFGYEYCLEFLYCNNEDDSGCASNKIEE
jgi:hypothetical protein